MIRVWRVLSGRSWFRWSTLIIVAAPVLPAVSMWAVYGQSPWWGLCLGVLLLGVIVAIEEATAPPREVPAAGVDVALAEQEEWRFDPQRENPIQAVRRRADLNPDLVALNRAEDEVRDHLLAVLREHDHRRRCNGEPR